MLVTELDSEVYIIFIKLFSCSHFLHFNLEFAGAKEAKMSAKKSDIMGGIPQVNGFALGSIHTEHDPN